jgi:hypothetical protein
VDSIYLYTYEHVCVCVFVLCVCACGVCVCGVCVCMCMCVCVYVYIYINIGPQACGPAALHGLLGALSRMHRHPGAQGAEDCIQVGFFFFRIPKPYTLVRLRLVKSRNISEKK